MKHKRNNYIRAIILIQVIVLAGCSVFFEEDITERSITLIAPADKITTEIVTQAFWWGKDDDATGYRLQIASPDFAMAETVLLDTLVTSDKFELTLYPGLFEWRVRAENSAYQSMWSTAQLTVIASDDLSRQRIRLRSPIDNLFTNKTQINYKWDTIPNVDSYELRLYKNEWGKDLLLDSINITQPDVSLELEEGEIWWGIRAVNQLSESLFSYQRLVIDITPPQKPVLTSPDNNLTQTDTTVIFKWNSADPKWNEVNDSLFVYEQIGTSGLKLFKKGLYSSKTGTIDLDAGKTYNWKVKSTDRAGNEGEYSEERIIIIGN